MFRSSSLGPTLYGQKRSYENVVQFRRATRGAVLAYQLGPGPALDWIPASSKSPSIVVLLSQSLPFLAYSWFVYVLGALEVIAGVMLIAGLWVRYVGLLTLVHFCQKRIEGKPTLHISR